MTLLVTSATVSGALVGLVAALVAAASAPAVSALTAALPGGSAPLGTWSPTVAAAVAVGTALTLDGLVLATGRPRPPATGRQVPQAWGRLLGPAETAVLYGFRLGIGPATILSTWTWWAVTITAAVLGPVASILVGATFGLVRMAVTVALSLATADPGASGRFGRLHRRERSSWATLNLLAALAVGAVLVAGCSAAAGEAESSLDDRPVLRSAPATPAEMRTLPTLRFEPGAGADTASTPRPVTRPAEPAGAEPVIAGLTELPSGAADGSGRGAADADLDPTPPPTTPALLEDVVRSDAMIRDRSEDGPDPVPGLAGPEAADPEALAAVLLDGVDGFVPVAGPGADRHLDLAAAAALQPDPTEEVALLETRGFRGGWTRAFRSTANDILVTSVYQFADAGEAEFYLEDGLITIGGYGGGFFDIEDLSGVRGFTQTFDQDGEELRSLGATFHAGSRWYLVYLVGSADTVRADVLIPAVHEQRRAALAAMAPAGPTTVVN